MFYRDKLLKIYFDFCSQIGIDPFFPMTILLLLLSINLLKDLKNWNEIPSYRRNSNIVMWILTSIFLVQSIISVIERFFKKN